MWIHRLISLTPSLSLKVQEKCRRGQRRNKKKESKGGHEWQRQKFSFKYVIIVGRKEEIMKGCETKNKKLEISCCGKEGIGKKNLKEGKFAQLEGRFC